MEGSTPGRNAIAFRPGLPFLDPPARGELAARTIHAMSLFIGIDVGTSGTKAVLLNQQGQVVATGSGSHAPSAPRSGWSEQDPDDWWPSTIAAINQACRTAGVAADTIEGVGITGQMHGLVALDSSATPIRPAILWNDGRSAPQCQAVEARIGIERLVSLCGNRMLPGFTAPKLLWMREHEPEAYARITTVLLPKDWIRYRLSGELVMDVSDASGTAVFDCANRTWSDELLGELDLPRSWWPHAAEGPEIVASVHAAAAAETGLREGIPIVAGAGDQAASAIGTGLITEGTVGSTLGTSGVVFAPTDQWRSLPDGRLHAFCHAVPGRWHLMGVMLSGAGSLDWFRSAIVPDIDEEAGSEAFPRIESMAEEVPAGADGVLFLPYLSGERTPYSDVNARGTFIGLDQRHDRRHLARAVFEGVTHGLAQCLDLVRAAGVEPETVRLSGGGAKSPLWRQTCADLFGVPTTTTTTTEGTACGAAILAAVGAGAFPSVEDACHATVSEVNRTEAGPNAAVLAARHSIYERLYPALKPLFPDIAADA
jgi:xylulokinase